MTVLIDNSGFLIKTMRIILFFFRKLRLKANKSSRSLVFCDNKKPFWTCICSNLAFLTARILKLIICVFWCACLRNFSSNSSLVDCWIMQLFVKCWFFSTKSRASRLVHERTSKRDVFQLLWRQFSVGCKKHTTFILFFKINCLAQLIIDFLKLVGFSLNK